MPTAITVPARSLAVLADVEVLVCGAGPAGCAAAVSAARHGAETLLVEKTGACGGAPVTQLVGVVLSTNGIDFQGIWHEWARCLQRRNGITRMVRSPSHHYKQDLRWFRASVDPEMVKWAWEELLDGAGAQILFHATVTDVVGDGESLAGVCVHTRAGNAVIRAKRIIDATGDGIVCHQAGVPWHRGTDKPWPQEVSLNQQVGWTEPPEGYRPGEAHDPTGPVFGNRPERLARRDMREVDPLDPWEVTRAQREMRRAHWEDAAGLPPDRYLVATAPDLGVRTSRIIRGIDTVTEDDAWKYRKRDDGIARSSWELDVHPPDDAPIPDRYYHSRSNAYRDRCARTAAGEWFDIPCGALLPEKPDNLLAAGRIVSSELLAQGSLRIQQTCISTGQAAGAVAALSLRHEVPPRDLDVDKLQQALKEARDVPPAFECLDGITHQ